MRRAIGPERAPTSNYMSLLGSVATNHMPAHGIASVAVDASGETEFRVDMSASGVAKAVSQQPEAISKPNSTFVGKEINGLAASDDNVAAIYGPDYAQTYPSLYLTPWRAKHDLNVSNLAAILESLSKRMPDWLDLACGQAWHFAAFAGRARMVGLDLSAAQLERAQVQAPHASFIQQNMSAASFPPASFDLLTNFWAGYCYLASETRIASLLRKAVRWIRPGGVLYMEVLLAEDLRSFNQSAFAGQTGFAVKMARGDNTSWRYEDIGGTHTMTSPPLEWFVDLLAPAFGAIEARHDRGFMVHLIARDKKERR